MEAVYGPNNTDFTSSVVIWLPPLSAQADNSRSRGWLLLWHHLMGSGDNPATSYIEPLPYEGAEIVFAGIGIYGGE